MTIELGVIRVTGINGREKTISVYNTSTKEFLGYISINLNCPATEEKVINLLSILENK